MKKIGILGGSFNPVHLGHLILANTVLEKFQLDQILFIPCYLQPLKSRDNFATAEDRLKMLSLSIKGNKKFKISKIELNRKGKSFTVDTLRELSNDKNDYYFIIGADNLKDFYNWKEPREILRLAKMIVTNRGGIQKKIPKKIFNKKIMECKIPNIEISSTEIRNFVASKRSIKYFVSREVENFIYKKKLYIGRK